MQTDLSHLPTTAQKLVAVIGLPCALRLLDAYGGRTVNLYNSENSMEKMSLSIGREAAEKLFKFYGNVPFTVPTCQKAMKLVRNKEVLAEFDKLTAGPDGMSARQAVAQITRLFTPYLHERTIWRILKTTGDVEEVDPRQMSLI
ncbi:hypothetical protein GTP44_01100 [Duganella sp. FT50W]|uniref:Mor transcription activator domain-containing protein n=1 Tax=Duganella lactea TaxID=2692173 RepID=A0A6L8MCU8_9BURK|nr:Mor transcription activator family protein [Duganella lactea]MYM80557.1 hypothetical protein [Duganella lactea]